jgi:hypothetical protein
MSTTLWTALFAGLMAGATAVMLAILVGLVTDSAAWPIRESRNWAARRRLFCPERARQLARRCNS